MSTLRAHFLWLMIGILPALSIVDAAEPVEVIAFGSCNRHNVAQPLWSHILAQEPDLWIWTGDIIYADTTDIEEMRSMYTAQKGVPEYRALQESTRILGVYDDHDYGRNNAGKEYPKREESAAALLDFLDEPTGSVRRNQQGVYTYADFGNAPDLVRVILLDTRFHREKPGPQADILGETQWDWLEEVLSNSPARINLLVSSIQVLPEDHPYEKWANFPKSRARLFELIRRSRAPGVILISGDRHLAEISHLESELVPYPLYEITSSGLTHAFHSFKGEPNRHRIGEPFPELNFGVIRFDWEKNRLMLEIRDRENRVVLEQAIMLSELMPEA